MSTKKILVIAPTRIGDAVLASSILRHIAASEPSARVTIVTSPLAAPLFAGYPQLAQLTLSSKRSYNRHWLAIWQQSIGTRWHAIWDLRGSLITYALITKTRHWYRVLPGPRLPKIKQYETLFKTGTLPPPQLWPRAEDTQFARVLMPEGERFLVFAPIANWAPKEWPLDRYIALAKTMLDGACQGYRPVIICAGHERSKALPMLEALAPYRPIDLTHGDTHLLSVYAAMCRAQGFVGNDSGLMHMAVAAGIPTLGLFGPTPNIGETAAHVRYIFASNNDLSQLHVADILHEWQLLNN